MKKYKTVGSVVLLIIVLVVLLIMHAKSNLNTGNTGVIVLNTVSPHSKDKLSSDPTGTLSSKDINNIMGKIDSRVKTVKDRINYDFSKDYYDGEMLMFRYFQYGVEQESFTEYSLYYDEQGKLIYAEIAHYRNALYAIYFHNDALLHVEVGPFSEDGLFINGDMTNVMEVIKKDSFFNFVLEDNALCLEYAYR